MTMTLSLPRGKQARSILESTARINVWHGSVRSGKTVASIIRWLDFVAHGPPGELLMVGKTTRTLKRNILDPMAEMLGEDEFRLVSGRGEAYIYGRRVYLVGANDERAEGKIRGLTLVGAYGDEVTLWPESFFTMLLSRLSMPGAKFFGTTNADGPYHWLKHKYLDRASELDLSHWQFGLEDNPNLPAEYVEALKREYTGLWYKRFILGQWALAEGVVYDMFDPDTHVVKMLPPIKRHWVGIDYGTTNPTVFLLIGEGADDCLYVCREWRWDSAAKGRRLTDQQLSAEYRRWVGNVTPQRVFVDPSAASFIAQLYHDGVRGITPADNDVVDGIQDVSTLLGARRLRIHESCAGLIEEMGNYVWDTKAQERGEDAPIKQNDHGPDALRYAVRGLRKTWRRWVVQAKGAAV